MLPEQPGPLWVPLELIGTAGNGVSGLPLEVCKAPWALRLPGSTGAASGIISWEWGPHLGSEVCRSRVPDTPTLSDL